MKLQRRWRMEKRQYPRKRTLLSATALFNDGLYSVPCTIRDVSRGGMRLHVSVTIVLPASFELHVPSQRTWHHARMRWRRAEDVGIALCGEGRIALQHGPMRGEAGQLAALEGEIARLNALVARLLEERDAPVGLLGQTGRLREARSGSAPVPDRTAASDAAASTSFDVFDDERNEWQRPVPGGRR
jgi:hypothetical protein